MNEEILYQDFMLNVANIRLKQYEENVQVRHIFNILTIMSL